MHGGTFTGSPFAHPNAEKIGIKKGLLCQQDMDFRNGIGALRMGIRSRDVGYVPIPFEVDLVMKDGTRVRGGRVIEGTSNNPTNGDVGIALTYREEGHLYWTLVDIHDNVITATLHRNPRD